MYISDYINSLFSSVTSYLVSDPILLFSLIVYGSLALIVIGSNSKSDGISDLSAVALLIHIILNALYCCEFLPEDYVFLTKLFIFCLPYLVAVLVCKYVKRFS